MYKRSRLVRVRGPGGRYTFGGEVEVVSARGYVYMFNNISNLVR